MPRTPKKRKVNYKFPYILYKPAGICGKNLELIKLNKDELEAIRLVHLEGKTMEEGAKSMEISAPTFNRILKKGLTKIADALVNLKALEVEE